MLNTNHTGSGAHLADCLIWKGKCRQSIADLQLFPRVVLECFHPQQQGQKCSLFALNCAGNQKGTQLLPLSKQGPFVIKRWGTNKI